MKLSDSDLYNNNFPHGVYKVENKYFLKKINALLYASEIKATVHWDFNKNIYNNAIANNITLSLDELYVLRAKQLRDKYDYLILAYSGGADSHNILQVFLKNNIKIDEIITDWPLTLTSKQNYQLNTSNSPDNFISEYYLVVKPDLEYVRKHDPNIKITALDSFSSLDNSDYNELVNYCSVPTNYATFRRYFCKANYIDNSIKNKKTATIYGICKPILYGNKDIYGFAFHDSPAPLNNSMFKNQNNSIEYFYWAYDLPELVITQAKKMWEYAFQNADKILPLIALQSQKNNPERLSWQRKQSLNDFTNLICYPLWDNTRHQCDKPSFFKGGYAYFLNFYKDLYVMQNWTSNITNLTKSLDPKIAYQNGIDLTKDTKVFYNVHKLNDMPKSFSNYFK